MPRRRIFSSAESASLLAIPEAEEDLVRQYTLSERDMAIICQRRGDHNRLGFAVQLCYLRYPGVVVPTNGNPPGRLLSFIGRQLDLSPMLWYQYALRTQTRREHLAELQAWMHVERFTQVDYRRSVEHVSALAEHTSRAMALAEALLNRLREQRIILPSIAVIRRICSEALAVGLRNVYAALTEPLTKHHRQSLDSVLTMREGTSNSTLVWLRQPHGPPRARHILVHLDRLKTITDMDLPDVVNGAVHHSRLVQLSREGAQMTSQHFRDLEPTRRYATLVAVILDTRASLIDEIVDMHDQNMAALFSRAKRSHAEAFHESGKSINDKVRLFSRVGRALLEAKKGGGDPYAAIEKVIPWSAFADSIHEAERLSQPEEFDSLPLIADGYGPLRRYTPRMLEALELKATPAASRVLAGVEVIKVMNRSKARTVKVPSDAPDSFVRKRWKSLVHTAKGLDRRFYELCVLSELRNALRSGDIWIQGSRQFKDFEAYLLPTQKFAEQLEQHRHGLPVETDCDRYLKARCDLLSSELAVTERLAASDDLPDATVTSGRLSITPLTNAVPEAAEALAEKVYNLLPRIKITELLMDVADWTNFTHRFNHLKSGMIADDRRMLLTTVLADAVNLGPRKMAEACPGTTYAKLTWIQAWYTRDETYASALADIVNAQSRHPFAAHWGDGTTSSSDGQNFRSGGRGFASGQVNLKYGQNPGVQFYTHISDQYVPFHTKVISSTVRDATYVLDGLLNHESELRIKEHFTDTAGFTDQVFGMMHLLGYRFSPRIRDIADKRLYISGSAKQYPTLAGLIGGTINRKIIRENWDDLLRLAASIKQGTVSASLMMRKLASYPRQNGLALTLREVGRLERSLFGLKWMQQPELRRRVTAELNKGEAKNALSRAVSLNRLGEIRDRGFEDQRHRANGLNLTVAAIVLWNTVYLGRAVRAMRKAGHVVDDELLQHLSPVGWEHINLTGDYVWSQCKAPKPGKFRSLNKNVEK